MGPKLSNNVVSEAAEWILLLEHKLLKQCTYIIDEFATTTKPNFFLQENDASSSLYALYPK